MDRVRAALDLFPDTEMLEAVCRENEKDVARMSSQSAAATAANAARDARSVRRRVRAQEAWLDDEGARSRLTESGA
jgi:hypothetical protein